MCRSCYTAWQKPEPEPVEVPVVVHGFDDPDPSIRDLARQLQHLLDDRRDRGIPTEGREL